MNLRDMEDAYDADENAGKPRGDSARWIVAASMLGMVLCAAVAGCMGCVK